MAHIIRNIAYAGWQNCIHITNTVFEAVIVVDVGPRIVRYAKVGGPNLLWLDEFTAGQTEETKTWRAYGGHSFDAIVDGEAFLPPENTAVSYDLTADSVVFHDIQQGDIVKQLTVRMCRRGGMEIKQTILNNGGDTHTVTVNANTLLRHGGLAVMPLMAGEEALYGGKSAELTRGETLSFAAQNLVMDAPLRMGFALDELWCGYFTQGSLFIMTSPKAQGVCEDSGNLALEGSSRCFKMSTYSPQAVLKPGESVLHTVVWNIFIETERPQNEAQAVAALKNNKYFYEFCKKPVKGLDY